MYNLQPSIDAMHKLKEQRILLYNKSPRRCLHCKLPIIYDKRRNQFCSQRCSGTYNNIYHPHKRVLVKRYCRKCGDSIPRISFKDQCRRLCEPCRSSYFLSPSITIQELKKRSSYQTHARIRHHARTVYRQANLPQVCYICQYDKHIEVCHIHAISSFAVTTTISIVNDLHNLVALCRNHHWELDHHLLNLDR